MERFSMLVETSTHEDLKAGNPPTTTWVQVLAENETEAMLVGAQMAAATGRMPTQVTPEV